MDYFRNSKRSISLEEAVALGVAVQAAVLTWRGVFSSAGFVIGGGNQPGVPI